MDEKIDEAIENLVGMIRKNVQPEAAMKFSQAALNLAHAKHICLSCKDPSFGKEKK